MTGPVPIDPYTPIVEHAIWKDAFLAFLGVTPADRARLSELLTKSAADALRAGAPKGREIALQQGVALVLEEARQLCDPAQS